MLSVQHGVYCDYMLIYIALGVIIGMLISLSSLTVMYIVLYNNKTEIKQKLQSKLNKKGILIDPEENSFNNFINSLPHE